VHFSESAVKQQFRMDINLSAVTVTERAYGL